MKKNLILLLVGSIICCGLGCSGDIDAEAERTTLLETDRAWASAAAAGDIQRVATFWVDDAINYFPGAHPARGKKAILELVRRNRSQPGFSLTWEATHAVVSQAADIGYTSGTFEIAVNGPDGNPATRHGSYVCIWRKEPDGSWKCVVESSVFGPSTPH